MSTDGNNEGRRWTRQPRVPFVCGVCQQPATRWNGGIQGYYFKDGKMVEAPKYQFRCVTCDPRHKWFDIDEENDHELFQ